MLNKKLLDKVLSEYNIKINNYEHFLLAMTHSSYANEHNMKSNERIEFLGDAVLQLIISDFLFVNSDQKEGSMSKTRASYVCEKALCEYEKSIGFIVSSIERRV